MSHADKSAYYRELKVAGFPFTKTYQQYSTQELAAAVAELRDRPGYTVPGETVPPHAPPAPRPVAAARLAPAPLPQPPKDTVAGLRLNTHSEDDILRVDDDGTIWYQDEVRKPSYPKPRGRRVLDYIDPGSKMQTAKSGDYIESFEVAGNEQRQAQVKITLPSYQVGIYKDPRFPFKIHVYNDNRGFDREEVELFYGGAELVPTEVRSKYVENVLCYDMRTTVRAIQAEYRQRQLAVQKGITA